jgi:hypothetical protein
MDEKLELEVELEGSMDMMNHGEVKDETKGDK